MECKVELQRAIVDNEDMKRRFPTSIQHLKINSLFLLLSSAILIGWMVYLVKALPSSYRAEHWDLAWVGFDAGMLAALLTTSWAMWKQRQIAIPGAMISATFLIIDSWFDVVTSHAGVDFKVALVTAALVEIPAAALLFQFSRSAMKSSIKSAYKNAGKVSASHSPWRTPLLIFDSNSD
jgi:hypothetical protein